MTAKYVPMVRLRGVVWRGADQERGTILQSDSTLGELSSQDCCASSLRQGLNSARYWGLIQQNTLTSNMFLNVSTQHAQV